MRAVGVTDLGQVRTKNEDCHIVITEAMNGLDNLLVVADGMGGHKAGEVASATAVNIFVEYIKNNTADEADILDFLIEGVRRANKEVYDKSLNDVDLNGMGTTFTACSVCNGRLYTAHVGDSRLYVIGENGMIQITNDHSFAGEMVRAGQMTQEEARVHPKRNALTRALGIGESIEVDGFVFDLDKKDRILICSDGLTDMIKEEVIFDLVMYANDIVSCAQDLVSIANHNGGVDNITVVLAETER